MEEFITTNEAAQYLKVKPQTMRLWASQGRGPKYSMIEGARRYELGSLRAWATGKATEPRWQCSTCGKPADKNAALVVSIDHAVLRGDADWGVIHHDCPRPPLPNPYEIAVEEADTWAKIANWTAHLWEKEWAHQTNLAGLIRKAGGR